MQMSDLWRVKALIIIVILTVSLFDCTWFLPHSWPCLHQVRFLSTSFIDETGFVACWALIPSCFGCSGWKRGQTDRCVRYVKQASAEIKWSPCMDEAARVSRIPGEYSRWAINKENYIVYIQLMSCFWDFRERTPPRPQGQRPEPENRGVRALSTELKTCPPVKSVPQSETLPVFILV